MPEIINRCLLRGFSSSSILSVLYFFLSTAACSTSYAYLHPTLFSQHTQFRWACIFGSATAALYTFQHFYRCRDVLLHSDVRRHRYFQIKTQIPSLAMSSFKLATWAMLAGLLLRQSAFPGLLQLIATWLPISVCLFGWLVGHALLMIVLNERLRLKERAESVSYPLLITQGLSSEDGVVQDLTLVDLADTCEEGTTAAVAARQMLVYADQSGLHSWVPVANLLIGEVRDLTTLVASALPLIPSDKSSGAVRLGTAAAAAQWNVKSATSAFQRQNMRDMELAAWALRSKYSRFECALRILSSLAAASRGEDRYGVLLLCEPGLADVVLNMASALLALQQYTKMMTSRSVEINPATLLSSAVSLFFCCPAHPCLRKVELLSHSLENRARTALYRIVLAFGPPIKSLLKEAKQKPAFGSASKLNALVQNFLDLKE
ncbi:hypothetical protein CEUSTIGMA_g8948.t1 [Chlamydomonas eustigma]|uniref:Nucleoporin protein Ndc1-Nup n=1 Tax=Chlamydomonas eustigma TaxID=1157962 RepID=A0A250XFF9_9CHLO|nr:hypothetical protein CEUSTIGMA_g8948.t1 [Chlamydomonas eustigma]|eukprot:GAX81520.1 hypothetical protein CEUSTIGMA_g8948.t1 [Chlamydomonas eustigma]